MTIIIVGILLVFSGYLVAFRKKTWLILVIWTLLKADDTSNNKQDIVKYWFGCCLMILGSFLIVEGILESEGIAFISPYESGAIIIGFIFFTILIGVVILSWPANNRS